jgi:hypothetical protein
VSGWTNFGTKARNEKSAIVEAFASTWLDISLFTKVRQSLPLANLVPKWSTWLA